MAKRESVLGRGLEELLGQNSTIVTSGSSSISEIDIEKIFPNPNQPRTVFDEEALQELSDSIKSIGLITPITLKKNDDGTYQIIAGERRYRASKLAGLKKIPAYVKTSKDENVLIMALIENIQRENLNAIEIALTYQKLIEQSGMTQEALSESVGKKRATIANYLRLLRLPAEIQVGLTEKKIDMGHSRALLALDDAQKQLLVYKDILKNAYSVRKTEEIVRNLNQEQTEKKKEQLSEKYLPYQQMFKDLFGKKVTFSCDANGKGKVSISFSNEEELNGLLRQLQN